MRRAIWVFVAAIAVCARASAEPRGYHGALELQSSWTWTEGAQQMERWGPSWAVRYYLSDALALGITGTFYTHNADTNVEFDPRRATRIMPLDEYEWQSEFTVTYAFLHGGWRILHFDAYAVAGVGVLSARPAAVVDPIDRHFDFRPHGTFGTALGLRVFVSRWFATSVELRDFAWCGPHENMTIAPDPTDRATWYGPAKLNDNVQLQLGFAVFVPL